MAWRHTNTVAEAPLGTANPRDGVHVARAAAGFGVRGDRPGQEPIRMEWGKVLQNDSLHDRF